MLPSGIAVRLSRLLGKELPHWYGCEDDEQVEEHELAWERDEALQEKERSDLEAECGPLESWMFGPESAYHAVVRALWGNVYPIGEDYALQLGLLGEGYAIATPEGPCFWYSRDVLYRVDDKAMEKAPDLPQAPADVTVEKVRDAAACTCMSVESRMSPLWV